MISDEGQMKAARIMMDATERMYQANNVLCDRLDNILIRLDDIVLRFENSVDRYILDYPGP